MKDRIHIAIVCLHLSAVLYLLTGVLGVAFTLLMPNIPTGLRVVMAIIWVVVGCAFAAGAEVVVWGLKRRKFWAWVAGLCVFGLYVPSLFLPLGAAGLWSLLVAPSRRAFRVGVPSAEFGMRNAD